MCYNVKKICTEVDMNTFTNRPIDAFAMAKKITEENNKTLREIFKNKINGSFLIKIKSAIFDKIEHDLPLLYSFDFNNVRMITGMDETPEYDICKMIVGIHRHHSIFLSEQEIRNNQKDKEYQEQIVNEVIEKVRLRAFGSAFFRKRQLFLGDEFLYFAVPYELFVLCMRSAILMGTQAVNDNYRSIINSALSSLTLMENGFLSNAYPLCRGMIEKHLKTLILNKHPETRKNYELFRKFEIEQSCCSQKYPSEFLELYDKRAYPSSKSKVDYLHYGWLDAINDYTIKSSNRYSIYGIFEYLIECATEEQRDVLEHMKVLYKMCHGYTHGSAEYVKYPLLQYFEISAMIYYVITNVFVDIHRELKSEISPDDKELLNMLDRDFSILFEQYSNRSTDNFELYYSIHKS